LLVDVHAHRRGSRHQPGQHGVDRGAFLGDEQHLRPRATIGDQVGDRLALAVPGGPWMTELRPSSTVSIALRWEESASSTE
jgi:hypothetical protein